MKKTITALALALCIAAPSAIAAKVDVDKRTGKRVSDRLTAARELNWAPGQVIVKYKTAEEEMPAAGLRALGLSPTHIGRTSGGEYIYAIPQDVIRTLSMGEARTRTEAAVQAMATRPDVEYAQPNYILKITRTPDDPGYPLQWHYFTNGTAQDESPGGINLPDAWDRTTGDPGVVIAVIDTGILPNHPDITGSANLAPGFDMISDIFTGNDGDGRDADPTDPGDGVSAGQCGPGSPAEPDSWHGTHVAGTVGIGNTNNGNGVAGVNWVSRVQAVRALGRCGGSIADINDAIRWAAGLPVPGVPANNNPARVINMSLGAPAPCSASPATQAAINDAVAAGVTVVAAAGNEAQNAANSFPAGCDGVITVAASDYNGELVTRYSNFGAVVEIMAPGGDVQADEDNDGNPDGVLSMVQGGFAFFNGTSMASPHVAGVAGLLLAQDPTLTPQAIQNLITANAIPRTAQQCPQACGAGLLNADIQVGGPIPPAPVLLSVSPTSFDLDEGDTGTLTATVRQGGAPLANQTVSFTSSNTSIVTVAPPSGNTSNAGTVSTTVTGVSEGSAQITVSVQGQTQTANVAVEVDEVPALGLLALALLMALILLLTYPRSPVPRRS